MPDILISRFGVGARLFAVLRVTLLGFLFGSSLGANPTVAADTPGCDVGIACRPAGLIRMDTREGPVELGWMGGPYVDEQGSLSVLVGETLSIQLDNVGGILVPRVVDDADADPETTIAISFKQGQIPGRRLDMLMVIDNPFDELLVYKAGMVSPGNFEEVHKTSTCPVGPHISTSEHWQDPILELLLFDFRLEPMPEGEFTLVCE